MPTTTDHSAPELDAPKRGLFSARTSAIAIVVASVATLAVVFVILTADSDAPLQVYSVPAQPDSPSQQLPVHDGSGVAPTEPGPTAVPASPAPAPIPAAAPTPSPAVPRAAAQTPALEFDSLGFVDNAARCDTDQRAAAIARTERAAVVVCEDSDGSLEYQGVRLHDGAALQLDDVRPMAVGFEARNGATTYRLSPTELVVISGETLQSRDPILEYRADEG
jgi:hypothetical protein